MSQYDDILNFLKNGNTITALDALEYFKCFRLAARVSDMIRKKHPIESEFIQVLSTDGEGKRVIKRVKKYWYNTKVLVDESV